MNRKEVLKTVDKMLGIIEKCGGTGSGIPGPCPTGAAAKPTPSYSKTAKSAIKAMPAGTTGRGNRFGWSKKGGYAGEKSISKTVAKMKALGFVAEDSHQGNHPDGSWVASGTKYRHPEGHSLRTNSHYGAVKSENHFSIELNIAEGKSVKCGGPGSGIPGPCPTGIGKPPGGGRMGAPTGEKPPKTPTVTQRLQARARRVAQSIDEAISIAVLAAEDLIGGV